MATINPGAIVSLDDKLYRVESCVKVTVTKGKPFMKTKLHDLATGEVMERNFKPGQTLKEVSLAERDLEFLYIDDEDYLFLDIGQLDQVLVPGEIIGEKDLYLKEGTRVKGTFYGDIVAAIELPQFLELMVKSIDGEDGEAPAPNAVRKSTLETGARVDVPGFVESGDIIKVDTKSGEYIQRV